MKYNDLDSGDGPVPRRWETKLFAGSWAHTAYARGRIVVRADREILCAKLVGE